MLKSFYHFLLFSFPLNFRINEKKCKRDSRNSKNENILYKAGNKILLVLKRHLEHVLYKKGKPNSIFDFNLRKYICFKEKHMENNVSFYYNSI